MDTSVVVQMSAQDAELVAAWQRARQGPAGMGQELDKVKRKGKEAGEQTAKSFELIGHVAKEVTGSFASMITPIGAIASFSKFIKADWDAIHQRMEEAAGTQADLAASQKKMFEALGPKADISRGELSQLVQSKSVIPIAEQNNAITAALKKAKSAGFSERTAVETGMEAGKLGKSASDEERQALARGAVELQISDKKLSPAQAVAQMKRFTRMSESTGLQVNESLTKGIQHVQENAPGTSAGDAAGFILGIQKQANLGEVGDAASIAEKIVVGMKDAKVSGNLGEMLNKLGKNKKAQEAVTKRTRRNVEAFATIQGLFKPGSETNQAIAKAQSDLGGSPDDVLTQELQLNKDIAKEPGQLAPAIRKQRQRSKEKIEAGSSDSIKYEARLTAQEAFYQAGEGAVERGTKNAVLGAKAIYQDPETFLKSAIADINSSILRISANQNNKDIVEELRKNNDKLIDTLLELKEARDKPQKVEITGDKRPSVAPQPGTVSFADQ